MTGMWAILAATTLGLDVGWQPLPDGGFEYIIQIDQETLESLKNGQDLRSEIPPMLRGVRSYRITVGNATLPREGEPPLPVVPGPDDSPATDEGSVATGTTALKAQANYQPPYNYGQPNYAPGAAPAFNPSAPATSPPAAVPRYAPAPTYVQPTSPAAAGSGAAPAPSSNFAAPPSNSAAPSLGGGAPAGNSLTPPGGFSAPLNNAVNSLEQATKDAAAKAQQAIDSVNAQTEGLLKNLPEPPGYETPATNSGSNSPDRYSVPPGQTPVTHDTTTPGSSSPLRGRGADEETPSAPAGATSPGTGGFAYPGAPPSIRSQTGTATGNDRGSVGSALSFGTRSSDTKPLDGAATESRTSTFGDRSSSERSVTDRTGGDRSISDRSGTERTTADKVNTERLNSERSSGGSANDENSSRSGRSDERSTGSTTESRPWMPLIGAMLALFASMGANLYLGWNTLALRNRYRDLVMQLHAS